MKKKGNITNYIILKQVIAAAVLSFVFYSMVEKSTSYTWIFSVLDKNLTYIEEHPDLTYEQKMTVKHGFKYKLCDHINKTTPEDAIILIPSTDAVKKAKELDNNKSTSATLANKSYASYFIYPRVFMYPREKDANPLWDSITHVAIIDFVGYDYLDYKVKKKSKYQILPKSLKK